MNSSIRLEIFQLREKKIDNSSKDNRIILIKIILRKTKIIIRIEIEVRKINKTMKDKLIRKKKEIKNIPIKTAILEKSLKNLRNEHNYKSLYYF